MSRKVCMYCGEVIYSKNNKIKFCSIKCRNDYKKYKELEYERKKDPLLNDVHELEEYNKKHKTNLSYGKFKGMKYIESLKKKGDK